MSHKGSKSEDKRSQWWSSISKEKLDALRWTMLHSGLNVAALQNDDGFTGIQVAAMGNKPKALLVILDVLRQKRELAEAVDVATDETGMTPLMLACQRGADKCAEHLMYYGASLTRKSSAGMTARDYAVASKHAAIVELIDDELGVGVPAADEGVAEAADADGLTSTQRNRLKKKQLREAANKGVLAAIAAAAPVGDGDEGGEEGAPGGGVGAGAAAPLAGGGGASASASTPAPPALPHGLLALPPRAPEARWPELKTAFAEKRRELTVSRVVSAGAGAEDEAAAPPASSAAPSAAADALGFIDPALWHHGVLNRLELHVPGVGALPSSIGHLSALQTLILSGCGLASLPESLAALADLKFLDVSNNALPALPAALGKLLRLEVLDVRSNALASLAPLAPLAGLVSFLADNNAIVELPLNFAALARLETLTLSHNRLAALPEELGLLTALANLNVAANELTELPAGLAELKEKKIKELKLLPNPFADKKLLKIINADRPEKVVKELWKHLADAGKGKGGKGKR